MCGIYGVINRKIGRQAALDCLNTLTHRGPDGYGLWQEEGATLGHRRLSILDLSDAGSQPMSDATGRYWLTFNGEIYNFLELREELKKKGYAFRGESDSEVILAAFAEWKEECLQRFNGMWAFAIWDTRERRLFISRDRFGVKPLFYTTFAGGGFAFASEMKALTPMLAEVRPNQDLFEFYKTSHHYEMREDCLIEGIRRFPAGSYAWVNQNGIQITRWWNTLDHLIGVPETYEEQVEYFRELFLDACKLRMRSDVTIGTALSGGLDSSATICGMAHLAETGTDARMSSDWQHAYVACFPGTPLDETKYARIVTDYLGISHTFLDINMRIPDECFLEQMYLFEELWENPQIPMMEIYRKEREDGTRVSIDGHAADELFAGYGFDVLKAYPDAGFDKKAADEITRAWLNQTENSDAVTEKAYEKRRNRMHRDALVKYYMKKALGKPSVRSAYASHENWKRLDNLNQTLFVSTHETILPTMLRNYDRDSMANGVEIRMPFLDYRIVQFAFSIGWRSKLHNAYTKSVIRDAIAPFAPKEIAYRRTKIGFNAPAVDWMRGIYKDFYLDIVNSAGFANCALVEDAPGVRAALDAVIRGEKTELGDATAVWDRIQPYLWEQAFVKQSWRSGTV